MHHIIKITCILVFLFISHIASYAANIKPITSHGLSLFSHLKYDSEFTAFDYVNPNAPKGGKITLSAIGGFDSFNAFNGKGEAAPGLSLLHDRLLQRAYDEAGSEYGLIAEKVTYPQDFKWVEYYLRKEAKFSDGQPITADDIIFSFNILREKGDPLYRYYYKNIKSVEKINDHQVHFEFDIAGNRELPLITGQLPILAKHYWENKDFTKATLEAPVVSGQYQIDVFQSNRSITYKRNKNYWAENLPVRKGMNNFDIIKYELYRDNNVAFEAFKAGQFDYYTEISAKNWTKGYDIDAVRSGKIKKKNFTNLNPKPFQGLIFNLRKPVFQNKTLRQVLNLTFDFEWLNKNLFHNAYARTSSFFEGSEMAAKGKPTVEELALLKELDLEPEHKILTADINQKLCDNYRKCARVARRLLKKGGYHYKKGILYDTNNEKVTFEVLNTSPAMERVLLPMLENMKKIGIHATLRTVDTAQYVRVLNAFEYDAIVGVWAQSPSPGNEQREYWSSAAAERFGSRNYAGIRDKAIDQAIEKLIFSKDRKSLVVASKILDRLLREKQFAIPMWYAPFDRIAYWDKFNLPPNMPSYGAKSNISFWWKK